MDIGKSVQMKKYGMTDEAIKKATEKVYERSNDSINCKAKEKERL